MKEYRRVLGVAGARRALAIGLLIRIPMMAANVILVLHVVDTLALSYGAAGAVSATYTVTLAISGPWRGRLLDRYGLRRTVLPCVLVGAACWAVAPWVGYLPLLALVAVAGLFVVPTFSIIRQWLIASTPAAARKTAMVLDSVATEMSFMIGPAVGVVVAIRIDTGTALLAAQALSLLGGLLLFVINPPMRHRDEGPDTSEARLGLRRWVTPVVVAVFAAAAAATTVLSGGDVGVVAAMRAMGQDARIGLVLTVWGLGSVIGGLVYGAMRRTVPVFWLLLGLGVSTLPIAFTTDPVSFCIVLFVSGLFCAPTIAATTDHLSRIVPARVRGEALGWHGSAMTGGSALGAPMAGIAIDQMDWRGAFIVNAAVGLLVALLGLAAMAVRARRRRRAAGSEAARSPGAGPAPELPTPIPAIEDSDSPLGCDLDETPGGEVPTTHR